MTNNILTLDQKVDLLLSQFSVFGTKLDVLTKNQNDLIKTVGEIAMLSGKTSDNLEDLAKEVFDINKEASDISDEQETHGKKLDQLSGSGSFSPFKSGAFAA